MIFSALFVPAILPVAVDPDTIKWDIWYTHCLDFICSRMQY